MDRDTLVVLHEAFVQAVRQLSIGRSGRQHQLVGPGQTVDQLVDPAQLRHLGLGRRKVTAAGGFLSRHAGDGNRQCRDGNDDSDGVLSHLHVQAQSRVNHNQSAVDGSPSACRVAAHGARQNGPNPVRSA
ncbi:MAG: hypothetical protein F4Y14_21415 [Acidobacteria bacterium]|nr:hypothetical protein [Acidobacteriota bacterium]